MLCTSNNLLPAKYLFNSLKPENHLLNIARYSLFLSETLIVVFSIFLLISLGKKYETVSTTKLNAKIDQWIVSNAIKEVINIDP